MPAIVDPKGRREPAADPVEPRPPAVPREGEPLIVGTEPTDGGSDDLPPVADIPDLDVEFLRGHQIHHPGGAGPAEAVEGIGTGDATHPHHLSRIIDGHRLGHGSAVGAEVKQASRLRPADSPDSLHTGLFKCRVEPTCLPDRRNIRPRRYRHMPSRPTSGPGCEHPWRADAS